MQTIEYSGIFLSHFSDEATSCVPAAKEHYLTFVHSGELEFEIDSKQIFAHEGECVFLRRNHKLRYHKKPFENKPYKGISIELSRESLRKYFSELNKKTLPQTVSLSEIDVLKIEIRPEILALFERIEPYYQTTPSEAFCKAVIPDSRSKANFSQQSIPTAILLPENVRDKSLQNAVLQSHQSRYSVGCRRQ